MTAHDTSTAASITGGATSLSTIRALTVAILSLHDFSDCRKSGALVKRSARIRGKLTKAENKLAVGNRRYAERRVRSARRNAALLVARFARVCEPASGESPNDSRADLEKLVNMIARLEGDIKTNSS